MRAEKLQRPGTEAAGRRHEPGVVRQTVPAEMESIGPQTQPLMEQVLRRENLTTAFKRVQAHQGAPGIDGMTVEELPAYLRQAWPGPIFDPDFSVRSDGFRPGRSAHQARERSCREIADGDRGVVNLDREKLFARVNHDLVRSRVARKVKDKRLLKLIRRDRNAGIRQDGVVSQREAGMPQGSPLSPLLSNSL